MASKCTHSRSATDDSEVGSTQQQVNHRRPTVSCLNASPQSLYQHGRVATLSEEEFTLSNDNFKN